MACAAAATGAYALSADHYANSSVLADGHWVKVRVNESGIQQITHEQLQQWGFNDPSAVTVYGFGGVAGAPELLDETVPDDLPQQPVIYRDDRILFYGESNHRVNMVYFSSKASTVPACPDIERNHAADAGFYLITDSQPKQQFEAFPYSNKSSLAIKRSHWEISYVEEEETNPVAYGQLLFGPDFSASSEPLKYSFPLDNIYYAKDSDTYTKVVLHQILVGSGSNMYYTLKYPSRNEILSKSVPLDGCNSLRMFSSNANTSDSYLGLQLPRTVTSFDLEISKRETSTFTYSAVDRIVFAFPQKNIFGDRSSMLICENEITAGQVFEFQQTTDGLVAWNVDKPYNVRPYTMNFINADKLTRITIADDYKISDKTDAAMRVILFDPSKNHNAVEYAGEVNNQNIHSYDVPDMIILSADAFVDQAERLAQIHRDMLGHDVLVLKQGEIFNEYSSGTPSLWGIRKAVKSFYDRNPDKLKHLLLFGASHYDNRGILTTMAATFKEKGALLLNYGTPFHKTMELVPTGYSCDGYFGMLCDTPPADNEFIFSTQNINVGRLPVSDDAEAAKAVDKVYQYLSYNPATDIYQRVLLTADFGDKNSHLISAEKTAESFLSNNPGFTVIKGYSGIYYHKNGLATDAQNAIMQALNRGVLYFNYTGHGKTDAIGYDRILQIADAHTMSNSYFPFGTIASCETYMFDNMSASLTQELVMQSNGGMIGLVAACREVYQTHNESLSESLADVFSKAAPGTTTGDILRMSRNQILDKSYTSNPGLIINNASYNLCGDPAIPLYFANHTSVIESVNGEDYADGDTTYAITPLVTNTISGYIDNPDAPGTPLESFNGTVIFSLYESPTTGKTVSFKSSDYTTQEVDLDEDLLIEVNAKVENGRFTVSFIPPMPTRTGDYNRATVTAVVPDNSMVATTYTKALKIDISDVPDIPDDTTAPVINEMYLDFPSFASGDVTAQNFTLYATLTEEESGINTSTGTIGNTTRIVIDNTMSYPVSGTLLNNNNDGTYSIVYPFTSFADGKHTLTLHTADNAGNTASRTIDFIINNNSANPSLAVEEQPARIQATFTMEHSFNGTPAGRIIIEDAEGNTVYTRDNVSFPFEWDLTDKNGNLVDDGVYRAYTICKGGTLYGATPKIDIVVIQKP